MANEIITKSILTIVSFIITGLLGYLTAKIKQYRKQDNIQQDALKCLLRSTITSKHYVYSELGAIPRYERENVTYMYEQYKKMGGNSYVDEIYLEIMRLPIKK